MQAFLRCVTDRFDCFDRFDLSHPIIDNQANHHAQTTRRQFGQSGSPAA